MDKSDELIHDDDTIGVLQKIYSNNHDCRVCFAIVGASESGKTTLLLNILQVMCTSYDVILLFSRTEMAQKTFANTGVVNCGDTFGPTILQKICTFHNTESPRVLLIMDDLNETVYSQPAYNQAIRQMRHYNVSVITITHAIKQLPASIRDEMNIFYVFKSGSPPNIMDMKMFLRHHFPSNINDVFPPNWHTMIDLRKRSHALFIPKNRIEHNVILFPTKLPPKMLSIIEPTFRHIIEHEFSKKMLTDEDDRKRNVEHEDLSPPKAKRQKKRKNV